MRLKAAAVTARSPAARGEHPQQSEVRHSLRDTTSTVYMMVDVNIVAVKSMWETLEEAVILRQRAHPLRETRMQPLLIPAVYLLKTVHKKETQRFLVS